MPSARPAHDELEHEDAFELRRGAVAFRGWEEISIVRSIAAVAAGFSVAIADRSAPLPILPGDKVELALGRDRLCVGYIDSADAEISAGNHTVGVEGRELTADLVDCAMDHQPGEWSGLRLPELLAVFASPFGIDVDDQVGAAELEPFSLFKVQPGETAWSSIERACRLRGVLATSSGDGRIVLVKPGASSAAVRLVEGRNVLSARASWNHGERFSKYTVKGQQSGTNGGWGAEASEIIGHATDPEVKRSRPLLVIAEGSLSLEIAQRRAEWEAAWRAAKGSPLKVVVHGWRQGPGLPVWSPNLLVPCQVPSLRVTTMMLLETVRLSKGEQGTLAELDLVRPDAYLPKPEVPPEDPMAGWGSAPPAAVAPEPEGDGG